MFLRVKSLLLPLPKSSIFKKINGVLFKFDFDYSPAIKEMYSGTYEAGVTRVLKKFLKEGDTFIDVGANIGYITAIGAGYVGETGQVHSFEPVPEYFRKLQELAQINPQYKIIVNRFALGDEEKIRKIYIGGRLHIGINTFFPEFLLNDVKDIRVVEVPVHRLDDYIQEKKLENIKLIKIDVEGYEFPVLKGLEKYFLKCHKTNSCPPILCEIVPGVYPSLGHRLQDIFDYMEKFSYYPFEIFNVGKRVNINAVKKRRGVDVLFKFSNNKK